MQQNVFMLAKYAFFPIGRRKRRNRDELDVESQQGILRQSSTFKRTTVSLGKTSSRILKS